MEKLPFSGEKRGKETVGQFGGELHFAIQGGYREVKEKKRHRDLG